MKDRRTPVMGLMGLVGLMALTALLALAAPAAAHAAESNAGPGQAPTPTPTATRVAQTLLDAMRDASGVPGMGAAVVLHGRLVWQGSSGWRDSVQQRPVDANTRFRLASVSKVFTATALARLAQDGLIDPQAPLSAAAEPPPWLPADWAAITPAQLAAHTAGVPHYELRDATRGRRAFVSAQDAAQAHLAGRELLAQPGQQYRYSSWGYTLLSAAIEASSGMSFTDYLARHVTTGLAIAPDSSHLPADALSLPGRQEPQGGSSGSSGEFRRAQHEGTPVSSRP